MYKIREGQAEEARQAVLEFIRAVREYSQEGVKVDGYVEKDGLTFYHVACFQDEQAEEAHTNSEQLANIWEAKYERAESFSQSISVDLLASTASGC
jgi:hypothetical protein